MHTSIRRNELIADLFTRMGKVERIGTGLQRMLQMMSDADLPEPIIDNNLFFTITFPRNKQFIMDMASSERSSERILKEIRKNRQITASQLSNILGVSSRAIEKQIAKLKMEGKIIRVGTKRYGHWVIKPIDADINDSEEQ